MGRVLNQRAIPAGKLAVVGKKLGEGKGLGIENSKQTKFEILKGEPDRLIE